MKPTNADLVNLLVIWAQEEYNRAGNSGSWDDPRTKEASMIVNALKKQILDSMAEELES